MGGGHVEHTLVEYLLLRGLLVVVHLTLHLVEGVHVLGLLGLRLVKYVVPLRVVVVARASIHLIIGLAVELVKSVGLVIHSYSTLGHLTAFIVLTKYVIEVITSGLLHLGLRLGRFIAQKV